MPASIDVIGCPVTALSFQDQIETMAAWAARRESRMICAANVHMLMEAHARPDFAEVLHGADLVTPDGMPLVWMLRKLGARGQDRVAGMDLLPALCRLAQDRGLAVYFLGSTPEVLAKMRERLQREVPGLAIAGMESPPFRPLTADEDRQLVARINDSGANFVMVSLGCPKQERWMHAQRGNVRAVMLGLGAAFPVYAGTTSMAPQWMRDSGIEWLYRLWQEPQRLAKRYLTTNLPFTFLALRQLATPRNLARS
jgi:N-acetylglucosaminyldiphosphoundecaprenol N-acetyl-beta-D-mannosaminyltransferase